MGSAVVLIIFGFAAGFISGMAIAILTIQRKKLAEIRRKEEELATCRTEMARLAQSYSDAREEAERWRRESESLREENRELELELTSLRVKTEGESRHMMEKLEMLERAKSQLSDAFAALSREALQQNSKMFFEMAREMLERYWESAKKAVEERSKEIGCTVSPLMDHLRKVEDLMRELESARREEMGKLSEQLRGLATSHQELLRETGKLAHALKTPAVRGRWGEIQLRRVAELAGLVEHCDFTEQQSASTEEGRMRPDMIVHLPGGRHIVVDAKASINAYLESLEATSEEERNSKLVEHARNVRSRVTELGSRKYWEHWSSPDFAVLFLPGENFFSSALEKDPGLIEYAAEQRVVLATPTTLIALLRAVAYGWRQETVARNAERVKEIGVELYRRLQKLVGHFQRMREGLQQAVNSFNDTVGSFESRVLVSARRFQEMGMVGHERLAEIKEIDTPIRSLRTGGLSIEGQAIDDTKQD